MLRKLLLISIFLWFFSLTIFIALGVGYSILFSTGASHTLLFLFGIIFATIISALFLTVNLINIFKK